VHGAERRDDLRDLGWEFRRGSIERLPEGSAGEQAEQHLDRDPWSTKVVVSTWSSRPEARPMRGRRSRFRCTLGERLCRSAAGANVAPVLEVGEQDAERPARQSDGAGQHVSPRRRVRPSGSREDRLLDDRSVSPCRGDARRQPRTRRSRGRSPGDRQAARWSFTGILLGKVDRAVIEQAISREPLRRTRPARLTCWPAPSD